MAPKSNRPQPIADDDQDAEYRSALLKSDDDHTPTIIRHRSKAIGIKPFDGRRSKAIGVEPVVDGDQALYVERRPVREAPVHQLEFAKLGREAHVAVLEADRRQRAAVGVDEVRVGAALEESREVVKELLVGLSFRERERNGTKFQTSSL